MAQQPSNEGAIKMFHAASPLNAPMTTPTATPNTTTATATPSNQILTLRMFLPTKEEICSLRRVTP